MPHRHGAAFLDPAALPDGLRLNPHLVDGNCDGRACFAAFHAAMAETALGRCGDIVADLRPSRGPAYGDEAS